MRSRKAPASSSPTATPQRVRSAARIRAEVAVARDPLEAGPRDQHAIDDLVRDGRIRELLDDERRAIHREQRDTAMRAREVLRVAAGDHAVLARLEDPARLRDE